jgi:hypothetical protein
MSQRPPSNEELADYVAQMLYELLKLSRPLGNRVLEYHLEMSANTVWLQDKDGKAEIYLIGTRPTRH